MISPRGVCTANPEVSAGHSLMKDLTEWFINDAPMWIVRLVMGVAIVAMTLPLSLALGSPLMVLVATGTYIVLQLFSWFLVR